jgi:hypothetical protein
VSLIIYWLFQFKSADVLLFNQNLIFKLQISSSTMSNLTYLNPLLKDNLDGQNTNLTLNKVSPTSNDEALQQLY